MTAEWAGPAVTAAIISSLIAIIGWLVSYRMTRRLETVRRDEKVRDFQIALLAEIRSERHHLATLDLAGDLEHVRAQYAAAEQHGRAYAPMVPRIAGPLVFPNVVKEIHILPERTIDPVVLYFRQVQLVERFIEDLRGERFRSLESARQIAMYADYIELMRYWRVMAEQACEALEASLGASRPVSSSASVR
ncbi:hypothetical protein SAMN05216548_108149 [Faunimonas pinastri]|uniref:Uncharacterized protein n=1 Tax=Faunimonas pinastri TaxID=1855383 RepID=A0A1H9JJ57_9HYPH|nr:hypothetical protein [Faunimonas pinastri]SEQ86944.1 hypothetical protein SAMN05216548_108149 [Faunimonas pinastri]